MIISEYALERKIDRIWDKAVKVSHGKCKKNEKDAFEKSLDKLLDITTCRHNIYQCADINSGCASEAECKTKIHIEFSCPKDTKIPKM